MIFGGMSKVYTPKIDYGAMLATAQRAMSAQEFYERDIRDFELFRQAPQWTADQIRAMQNYQRPVNVPQGWADWSAHASELAPRRLIERFTPPKNNFYVAKR